jgi:hypothetical protein
VCHVILSAAKDPQLQAALHEARILQPALSEAEGFLPQDDSGVLKPVNRCWTQH